MKRHTNSLVLKRRKMFREWSTWDGQTTLTSVCAEVQDKKQARKSASRCNRFGTVFVDLTPPKQEDWAKGLGMFGVLQRICIHGQEENLRMYARVRRIDCSVT
jgi:hypothetical protein